MFYAYSGVLMYHGIKRIVKELYREFPFDIIHAHYGIPEGYAGLMLASVYGKPLITTVRGTDIDIVSRQSNSCFDSMRKVVASSAAVITPSPRLTKMLYETFSVSAKTICNGIDPDEVYAEHTQVKLNDRAKGHTVLLSVSELIQSKGIDLNICAVKDLLNKGRRVYYIIAGDGPYRKKLEKLVDKLKIERYVEFVGTLTYQDVMRYMSICNIFTMPSWQETFGLVYLEAMAHGMPVIGCIGQGMDTIISENRVGLLAKPHDVNTLIDSLLFMLDNPVEMFDMGKRGRELVKHNFTHEKNALQTMNLYADVLQKKGHKSPW